MAVCNAVIILNFNSSEATSRLALEIVNYSCADKIVIVDNCSTDDSFENLSELARERIDVIRTERNGGYAYGNNYGCKYAIERYTPEYLTIANPDISFTEHTLTTMLEQCRSTKKCGAVGCMMNSQSSIKIPSAWREQNYWDCIRENLILLKKILGDSKLYSREYFEKAVVEVDAVAGSFFCIGSEVFRACGGFDEGTFLYYEETILAKRLHRIGCRNYLITKICYEHLHSESIDRAYEKKKRLDLAYKSRRYYMEKYLKAGKVGLIVSDVTYVVGRMDYLVMDRVRGKIFR
ncbi:Glycosyl transferase family 2 [Lachnospiraceae bacterium]|nr:Glycosyl transferase family 2 [Lachnospiraceae bacterium]